MTPEGWDEGTHRLWLRALAVVEEFGGQPPTDFSIALRDADEFFAMYDALEVVAAESIDSAVPVVPTSKGLEESLSHDSATAERLSVRCLYPPTACFLPYVDAHARRLARAGAECRAGGGLGVRTVIFDGRVAIVMNDRGGRRTISSSMLHANPGVVASVCDSFGNAWRSAVPLGKVGRPTLTNDHAAVLKILLGGAQNKEIPAQAGIPLRSAERIIRELKDRFMVESRSEMIEAARRMGWKNADSRW